MVLKRIAMPHLRSQRTGQRSVWKSPYGNQGAQKSMKNNHPIIKVEPSTSTIKKYSLSVKPSMSLQYIDEGSEKRLEAAFKSVIKYSLSTATTNFVEENVANSEKKPNPDSAVGPKSVSGSESSFSVEKEMKPSLKVFKEFTFSLVCDVQPDVSHFNSLHRCKTCSVPCTEFLDEFWGFPKTNISLDTDGEIVDNLDDSFQGSDIAEEGNDEFYGFERINPCQKLKQGLEVSGVRPCSVVLYRVKPCSVVLHRLNYSLKTAESSRSKNVISHDWQFPARNGKLVRRAAKKRTRALRRVESSNSEGVNQEVEDINISDLTILNVENNILLEPFNISVSVWDQFQEACNLSLQKEFVEDFCGFSHLKTPQ